MEMLWYQGWFPFTNAVLPLSCASLGFVCQTSSASILLSACSFSLKIYVVPKAFFLFKMFNVYHRQGHELFVGPIKYKVNDSLMLYLSPYFLSIFSIFNFSSYSKCSLSIKTILIFSKCKLIAQFYRFLFFRQHPAK